MQPGNVSPCERAMHPTLFRESPAPVDTAAQPRRTCPDSYITKRDRSVTPQCPGAPARTLFQKSEDEVVRVPRHQNMFHDTGGNRLLSSAIYRGPLTWVVSD